MTLMGPLIAAQLHKTMPAVDAALSTASIASAMQTMQTAAIAGRGDQAGTRPCPKTSSDICDALLHAAAEQEPLHMLALRPLCRLIDPAHALLLLQRAIELSDGALLKFLLASDARTNVRDWPELLKRLLLFTAREGNGEMMQILLAFGADVKTASAQASADGVPLLIAAEQDNTHTLSLLLAFGADPNVHDVDTGATPLHCAAEWDSVGIVSMLVRFGARVDARNVEGEAPLHVAIQHGNLATTRVLLDAGADVNASTTAGVTPLHVAAQEGHTAIVELLVQSGANVHAMDSTGTTPLHAAAYIDESALRFTPGIANPQEVIIQLLLQHGADLRATDTNGQSALHCAKQGNFDVIVDLLEAHQPSMPRKRVCRG
ncbi:TPA: hypothetical protein N0F65_009626 [Lagenidium giganteum]|uniref:Uncharacterized protein n=1 Tax=Lagenidium giganteum TaxID=4803 RepID=A0AAV2YSS1_9STRA|nr:TPA: hypothetical protein N0F65_009626 [Lagenidium giganteum]